MIESTVVNRWKAEWTAEATAEARVEQAAASIIVVLEAKFGGIPTEIETAVRACKDLAKLQTWIIQAAKVATLDEFRAAAGL